MIPPQLEPSQLESSWAKALEAEFAKPYMTALKAFIAEERKGGAPIFPPADSVFNAFALTPIDQVKVVIVGQDPYHGPGQAHGLCFSVQEGVPPPPSLKNIFKELSCDLGACITSSSGSLVSWAKQGVLLLNAILTVREKAPLSHQGKGWEMFTDAVIHVLSARNQPIVFLLWGKSAQQKCAQLIASPNSRHKVLSAPHPSPLSAHQGFLGCRHFSQANRFLLEQGAQAIDWNLSLSKL